MALKPTGPVLARNPWGPQAGKLRFLYGCDAASGSEFANLGTLRDALFGGVNGAASAAPTWSSGGEGAFAALPTSRVAGLANASGADYWLPRGTLFVRMAYTVVGTAAAQFFNTSNTAANAYCGSFIRPANTTQLRARFNHDSTQNSYLFSGVNYAVPFSFAMCWGPRGARAWVNAATAAAEAGDPAAYTGPLKILNGQGAYLGGSSSGVAGIDLYIAALWSVELDDDEMDRLWSDPYLPLRPAPTARLAHYVNPWQGRVSANGATYRFCSARNLSGSVHVRIKRATTAAALDSAAAAATATIAAPDTHTDLVLSDCVPGQRYHWRAEESADGVTFAPLPGGSGVFTTDPGRGAATTIAALMGDGHLASGIMPPLTRGDDVLYEESAPPLEPSGSSSQRDSTFGAAMRDIRREACHLGFDLGDEIFFHGNASDSTGDDTDDARDRAEAYCAHVEELSSRCPLGFVEGNHDIARWWEADADNTRSILKQGTRRLRKMVCRPDNSDAAGNFDWREPLDTPRYTGGTFDAAYRARHVNDAEGLNTAAESYGYQDYGDVRFFHLSVCRFSDGGYSATAEDSVVRDNPGKFRLGETQWAWLEATLAATPHRVKVILLHQHLGGAYRTDEPGWYGWESGVLIGNDAYYVSRGVAQPSESLRLQACCERFRVWGVVSGHVHKYAVCSVRGVVYLSVPTVSAHNMSVNDDGWHNDNFESQFGTAESFGAVDRDGNAMPARGLIKHVNCMGWVKFTYAAGLVRLQLRNTARATGGIGTETRYTHPRLSIERFVGSGDLTKSGNAVTLPSAPGDVVTVIDASALTGTWWESAQNNRATGGRTAWVANTAYNLGDVRVPTSGAGGFVQHRCTTAGTSHATTEPVWPTVITDTIADGTAVWTAEPLELAAADDVNRSATDDSLDDRGVNPIALSAAAAASVQVAYTPCVMHDLSFATPTKGSAVLRIGTNGDTLISPAPSEFVTIERVRFAHSAGGLLRIRTGTAGAERARFTPGDYRNLSIRGALGERVTLSLPSEGAPEAIIDYTVRSVQ